MIKNYDKSVETIYHPNWPYIPDHPYRILITGGSVSEKTVLLNLKNINHQIMLKFIYMSKIHLHQKYQLLITGREKGNGNLKNPKGFVDSSQTIDDVYENLEDYNLKRRVLIVLDDKIADIESNLKNRSYCY